MSTNQYIEKGNNDQRPFLFEHNSSKNLLISFGGIRQNIGMPIFEFYNSISDLDCDKIYIRDFNQAWYQLGVDGKISSIDKLYEFLEDIIEEYKYERIVCLGNSMGGYAAILFGVRLKATTILSFSPQSFIGKAHRIYYKDKRWSKYLRKIYRSKLFSKYYDLKLCLKQHSDFDGLIHIYYGSDNKLDEIHAKRLKAFSFVKLNSVEGDHNIVRSIRDSGQLIKLINDALIK